MQYIVEVVTEFRTKILGQASTMEWHKHKIPCVSRKDAVATMNALNTIPDKRCGLLVQVYCGQQRLLCHERDLDHMIRDLENARDQIGVDRAKDGYVDPLEQVPFEEFKAVVP